MNAKKEIGVDTAYAVKSPADNIQLYEAWADSYDQTFVEKQNYIYHLNVVGLLVPHRDQICGPVLDVGCGTGVVGVALSAAGFDAVDGVDISPQMLGVARDKKSVLGTSAYCQLIEADLTRRLNIPDNTYAGLISTGTFTHGHLGPDALNELWRVGAPGAYCAIGINAAHYESLGFERKLTLDCERGVIGQTQQIEVNIYDPSNTTEHAGDKALVVTCQIQ